MRRTSSQQNSTTLAGLHTTGNTPMCGIGVLFCVKLFCVILFLTFATTTVAQKNIFADSLLQQLEVAATDSAKAHIYSDLLWLYRFDDTQRATNYGLQALELYNKMSDLNGRCAVLNRLGIVRRNTGEYAAALDYFFRVISLARQPQHNNEIAYAYNNISDIYTRLDKYDKAIEYAEKAAPLFESANNKSGIAHNYKIRGIIYQNQNQWDSAINNYKLSLDIRLKYGQSGEIANSLLNIGECYMELNLIDSAFACYTESFTIFTQLGFQNTASYYIGFGKYYAAKKDYPKALANLTQAATIAQDKNDLFRLQKAYVQLHTVYAKTGNYKKAYEMQTLANNLQDSLQKADYMRKITTLDLDHQFEQQKKVAEIEELKKQTYYEAQIYRQKLVSYGLIAVLLTIGVVAALVFKNYKYVKRTNRILNENNAEIQERKIVIQTQNTQLQELNATKDKFFSIIAHDLKNPFNSILGFSSILMSSAKDYDPNEAKNFISIIHRSAQNAYKLLENLLDWARSQTGKIDFNPDRIPAKKLADDVINLSVDLVEAKGIKVSNKIETNTIAYADANMLNTIIRNLLTNAIKFTHKGGSISISAAQTDSETEITLSDTGVGMDEEIRNKLFKISERVTKPGTERETGTGLGLLLCKEFVEKHGGRIWVESEPGKGSDFKFTLPTPLRP